MKKFKKALAVLLILTVFISVLAGCGTKEDVWSKTDEEDNSIQDEQGNQEDTMEEKKEDTVEEAKEEKEDTTKEEESTPKRKQTDGDWSWPLSEQKELSIWLVWTNDYVDEPNELPAIQQIEKNTNVHINWITASKEEAWEKFELFMASGDYPDILRQAEDYYIGGLAQACDDGVIYDLTEVVPQYMPTYQALRESNEKLRKDTISDDGRMIGVNTIVSNNGVLEGAKTWAGMCIRQDWLDELNRKVPVTIDDWHDTLKAFKENFGCDAPLLISSHNGYDAMHDFLSAYGVLGEFYNDNGTVKYGPYEEGYKQWVQLFRDWYAEGLIDPNFIGNDADLIPPPEYMGTGRAGASCNVWNWTADRYKIEGYNQEENFFLTGAPTPVLNEGDPRNIGLEISGLATNELAMEMLCITKNCKDLELAARYLDYWYTEECMFLDSLGMEGESYVANGDGTYSLSDTLCQQVENGKYLTLNAAMSVWTLTTDDFGLYNNWLMYEPMYAGLQVLEAYDTWNLSGFDLLLPSHMTMTEDETNEFYFLYSEIKDFVQENTIKFITGAQSMDEYDNFVKSLKDYGIEECIRYKQAAYDRYQAR